MEFIGDISLILGIASTFIGIYLSFFSKRNLKLQTVREYYNDDNSPRMAAARKRVYALEDLKEEEIASIQDDEHIAMLCAHYEFYALMYQKKYLYKQIFDEGFGFALVRCNAILQPYINRRREENEYYAMHFNAVSEQLISNNEKCRVWAERYRGKKQYINTKDNR